MTDAAEVTQMNNDITTSKVSKTTNGPQSLFSSKQPVKVEHFIDSEANGSGDDSGSSDGSDSDVTDLINDDQDIETSEIEYEGSKVLKKTVSIVPTNPPKVAVTKVPTPKPQANSTEMVHKKRSEEKAKSHAAPVESKPVEVVKKTKDTKRVKEAKKSEEVKKGEEVKKEVKKSTHKNHREEKSDVTESLKRKSDDESEEQSEPKKRGTDKCILIRNFIWDNPYIAAHTVGTISYRRYISVLQTQLRHALYLVNNVIRISSKTPVANYKWLDDYAKAFGQLPEGERAVNIKLTEESEGDE